MPKTQVLPLVNQQTNETSPIKKIGWQNQSTPDGKIQPQQEKDRDASLHQTNLGSTNAKLPRYNTQTTVDTHFHVANKIHTTTPNEETRRDPTMILCKIHTKWVPNAQLEGPHIMNSNPSSIGQASSIYTITHTFVHTPTLTPLIHFLTLYIPS